MEGVQATLEKGLEHPEIKLVFTVGEEVGLKGAAKLKPEDVSTRPSLGYVSLATAFMNISCSFDSPILINRTSPIRITPQASTLSTFVNRSNRIIVVVSPFK